MRLPLPVVIGILVAFAIAYWTLVWVMLSLLGGWRVRRIGRRALSIRDAAAKGRLEDATAMVDAWADSIRPTDAIARLRLADTYASLGNHERALGIIETTRMPSSFLCRSLRRCGEQLRHRELIALGRLDDARWSLRDAERLDPAADWLHAARLSQAEQEGRPDGFEALRREAELASTGGKVAPSLNAKLSALAAKEGDFGTAAAQLSSMLTNGGARFRRNAPADVFRAIGLFRLASGDDRGADQAFEEYLWRSRDPSPSDVVATRLGLAELDSP